MAMSKQRKVLTLGQNPLVPSVALTLMNRIEHFIIDTFTRLGNDGIERPVEQPDQVPLHLESSPVANTDQDRGRRHLRYVASSRLPTHVNCLVVPH